MAMAREASNTMKAVQKIKTASNCFNTSAANGSKTTFSCVYFQPQIVAKNHSPFQGP